MMHIRHGFPEADRTAAAALYWDAFGDKLNAALGPEPQARAFVARVLDPTHAICAHDRDGSLLGVVGYKTARSALVGGTWSDMCAVYGSIGAAWRVAILALLDRDTDNLRFLMDGLFVAPSARGRGVGTALLHAVEEEARSRGYAEIRLDVIDQNTRARALYERLGYRAVETRSIGVLHRIFGYRATTTMVRKLYPDPINAPAANTSAPPTTT